MKPAFKPLLTLATALTLAAMAFIIGCSDDDDGGTNSTDNRDDWTVIIYAAGNYSGDTLSGQSMVIDNIQAMEEVDSSSTVNIIAMVASGAIGGVGRYYEIERNPGDTGNQISSTMIQDLGTTDMSSGQTMTAFLNWAMSNYAAKRYAVVVDAPGSGWRGCCRDDINGSGTPMSLTDLSTALSQAISQHGGGEYDVIAFTGGSMGMIEAAYQLRSVADYVVGTEFDTTMSAVFGWQSWMDDLVDNPSRDGNALAQSIVNQSYADANDTNPQTPMHLSVIAADSIANLATRLDMLGDTLAANGSNYWSSLQQIRSASRDSRFDSLSIDIQLFAELIQAQSGLNSVASIVAAADSVEQAANAAVILPKSNVQGTRARSLSIYFPDTTIAYDSTDYALISFQETGWTGFLSGYVNALEERITISPEVDPTSSGQVLLSPDKSWYSPDDEILLSARPLAGYAFDRWSDAAGTYDFNPAYLELAEDDSVVSITAHFVPEAEDRYASISGTFTWPGNTMTQPVLFLGMPEGGSDNIVVQLPLVFYDPDTVDFYISIDPATYDSAYYIFVTDNLDSDGTVLEANEPRDLYDADDDGLGDLVRFSAGQRISGIELQMFIPSSNVSRFDPADLPPTEVRSSRVR